MIRLGLWGLLSFPWLLHAQVVTPEVFAAAGHSGGQNSYNAWTIGEAFVSTLSSGSSMLTEGFHQPQMSIVGVPNWTPPVNVLVYPNPTANRCYVDFSQGQWEEVEMEVTSLQGQVILQWSGQAPHERVTIDLSACANGLYLLSVYTNNRQTYQHFRIEKIDY